MDNNEQLTEEQIEQLLARVGSIPQPPEDMRDRVKAQVEATWQETVQARQARKKYPAFAAAAVITLAIAVGWMNTKEPISQPVIASLDSSQHSIQLSTDGTQWSATESPTIVEGAYIQAMETASLSLSNTLNVRMKPQTVVQLTSLDELRLISGEIYLDSYDKPDQDRFSVITEFGIAEDIGTQFSVATNNNGWHIQVREGEVLVKDDSTKLRLEEEERVEINALNEVARQTLPDHHDSWQWVESSRPSYEIEGKTVDTYLNWVARETGRDLQYNTDEAKRSAETTLLHGSISGLTARRSIDAVLPATNFELMTSSENVIIVNKQ